MSRSLTLSVPLAVAWVLVALAVPPASVTVRSSLAEAVMEALSLAPVMVMLTTWLVPSAACTVKLSLSVCRAVKACTVALLLSSV